LFTSISVFTSKTQTNAYQRVDMKDNKQPACG